MNNIKNRNKVITVLGAGAVGKSIAADCALAGNETRLCDLQPFAAKSLANVERSGIRLYGLEINLYGFRRSGVAKLNMVTDDMKAAVENTDIIVIAVPSNGHKRFFEELIPLLEDGMAIHIIPDNYGSMIMRKMMKEMNCTKKVIIGGWSSSPYGTRVDMVGGVAMPAVDVEYRAITLRGAAMPACDQEAFIESGSHIGALDSIYKGDGPVSGDTALDTGFSNVNPILHCPGVILGVGAMENYGLIYGDHKENFSIYSHVYCPSVSRVQYALYKEEVELSEKLGVGMQLYEEEKFYSRESILGAEYMGDDYAIPFEDINHVAWGTGPTSIDSRYLTEDIPVGCHIFHELGVLLGIKTPIIDSMINLASALLERDYYEEGYTLKDIGIDNMTIEEINRYLREY